MARTTTRMFSVSIRLLLLGGLSLGLVDKATLAQNAYDRGTPAECSD